MATGSQGVCGVGLSGLRLSGPGGLQEQVQREQLAVEVSLHARGVAMREVLGAKIDLQPLDGALDAGAGLVAGAVSGQMLGVVPVDLREVVAVDADVPARALLQAVVGEGATLTNALAIIVVGGDPDVALLGDVPTPHLESVPCLADWHADGREAIDAVELLRHRLLRLKGAVQE